MLQAGGHGLRDLRIPSHKAASRGPRGALYLTCARSYVIPSLTCWQYCPLSLTLLQIAVRFFHVSPGDVPRQADAWLSRRRFNNVDIVVCSQHLSSRARTRVLKMVGSARFSVEDAPKRGLRTLHFQHSRKNLCGSRGPVPCPACATRALWT